MSTTITETKTRTRANSLSLRAEQYESDEDNKSQESFSTVVEATSSNSEGASPSQNVKQNKEQEAAKQNENSDTDEEDPSPCGRCRKLVVRGDEAVMCEICSQWYHIKCEKITKTQYKNQASKSKNFHWYCDACDIVHSGIIREVTLVKVQQAKFNQRLEELEKNKVSKEELQEEMEKKADKEEVDRLEKRVSSMEGKQAASGSNVVNEGASCSKSPEEQAEEVIKEIKDQEERKPNILVFNVPESNSSDSADSTKHDKEEVKQLAKQCKVPISKDEMISARRLGKKGSNPRPLLIQFANDEKKKMLFKNLKLLQNAPDKYRKMSVKNDLTEKQRKREKELREEAKKMENESSGESSFKVRGPPWARKIVKVEKKEKKIEERK